MLMALSHDTVFAVEKVGEGEQVLVQPKAFKGESFIHQFTSIPIIYLHPSIYPIHLLIVHQTLFPGS